MHKASTLERL